MLFRVGPWNYRVRVRRNLADTEGIPAVGLCDWMNRAIWIEEALPASQRLSVLLHELKHAWQIEFGAPANNEADADQAASFAADVWRQLERQGGEAALLRLDAEGAVDRRSAPSSPGEPRAAQCPTCHGLLNFPIRTSPPEFDEAHARLLVKREADCDFCGRVVRWSETVSSRGVPSGTVIGEAVVGASSA